MVWFIPSRTSCPTSITRAEEPPFDPFVSPCHHMRTGFGLRWKLVFQSVGCSALPRRQGIQQRQSLREPQFTVLRGSSIQQDRKPGLSAGHRGGNAAAEGGMGGY